MTDAGLRFRAALETLKFQGAESADYCGNIRSNEVATYAQVAAVEALQRGLQFTDVTTPTEFSTTEEFLKTEFAGRWTREFQFWKSRQDTQRAFWKLLKSKEGEVVGFARMAVRGRALPLNENWTPGALRLPMQLAQPLLIKASDCSLGPIGVANSQRGQGTGKVLLGLVLESLRNSPAEQICIDWTNAFKYYEPLNFEIARRYWTAWMVDPT